MTDSDLPDFEAPLLPHEFPVIDRGTDSPPQPSTIYRLPSTGLPEPISWTVQPWRNSPHRLLIILGFALIAGVLGGLFLRSVLLAAAGFAIILGSTAEFWLGSRYKVDENSASSRTGLSVSVMQWAEVKRVIVAPDYIKLSPLAEAGRMDPFRGVVLKFTGLNRLEVVDFVRERLGSDVRFLEV